MAANDEIPIVLNGDFQIPWGHARLSPSFERLLLNNDRLGVGYVRTEDRILALNIFPITFTPSNKQAVIARSPVKGHDVMTNGYVGRTYLTCSCGEEYVHTGPLSTDVILYIEKTHWDSVLEEARDIQDAANRTALEGD